MSAVRTVNGSVATARLLTRSARRAGRRARFVDGTRCRTEAALFAAMANAFSFPGYVGANWDALEEAVGDLDDVVIVVANAEHLLELATARRRELLARIVRDLSRDKEIELVLVRGG